MTVYNKADEIIRKSAVLLQKNATDKALAGEITMKWESKICDEAILMWWDNQLILDN